MPTHKDICGIAYKWLLRPNSQGGHGCHIAFTECRSGFDGEAPDAIGFRAAGSMDGSVVVECKVSRNDFLADRKKPHREGSNGMGTWRYYMAPEGIITVNDLPNGWGLLVVNSRGHVKAIQGAAVHAKNWSSFTQAVTDWAQPRNIDREQWILIKMLSRFGDTESVNQKFKELWNEQGRLSRENGELKLKLRTISHENFRLKRIVEANHITVDA